MEYYKKYKKYKKKYEEEKRKVKKDKLKREKSKEEKIIIHISGTPGSGKTRLGKELEKEYGEKIRVKDLDELWKEYINKIKKIDKEGYQERIKEYIREEKRKIIILVGINYKKTKEKISYYDLKAKYKYFIDKKEEDILRQKCKRYINKDLSKNQNKIIKKLIKEEEKTIEKIKEEIDRNCSLRNIKENNKKWREEYKKQEYKFKTKEEIKKEIKKIIKENNK